MESLRTLCKYGADVGLLGRAEPDAAAGLGCDGCRGFECNRRCGYSGIRELPAGW